MRIRIGWKRKGMCIMHPHFARGFYKDGILHPEFARVMTWLSKMNGWFIPVSNLLDHLRETRMGNHHIPKAELAAMELGGFFLS